MLKYSPILLALCLCYLTQALDVVRSGTPQCVISVTPEASASDRFAAEELQCYVKRLTGAELPILDTLPATGSRILLGAAAGQTDWSATDEIRVAVTAPETLIVTGEGTRGTLYAVYALLESWGVDFFSADDELIPQSADLTVADSCRIEEAPAFAYRQAAAETVQSDDRLSAKWRLNGHMYRQELPEALGGGYQMDMDHSLMRRFLIPDQYFATHPEWYAWRHDENKRVATQACLSNSEAVATLLQEVLAEHEKFPERRFVAIGCADNNQFCQCPACEAAAGKHGTPAAATLLALNQVARALKERDPEVVVMFQAYWSTERPPADVAFESNVGVALAILDRNHGLAPAATARYLVYLNDWSQLTGGKVYIWDYYATFGNFLLPMPNLYVMGDALRTYRDFGVKGVFAQLPFGTLAEFVDLRCWLFGQLMWNPDQDERELVARYLKGHYGAAAVTLQQYIDLLEAARDRNPGTWIGVYSEETKHWLTPDDILDSRTLFDQALAATADEPEVQRRVDGLRASILMTTILRYDEVKPAAAARGIVLPEREAMIDDLEKLGKEFNCTSYKEWDDFSNLIKRLRESAPAPVPPVVLHPAAREITPADFTGTGWQTVDGVAHLPSRQLTAGFQLQDPTSGEIAYVLPPELAGRWQVTMTLRVLGADNQVADGASLGIYAPNEITRLAVAPQNGAWQTMELGTHQLPPNSRIWVVFGVTGAVEAIEVKSITLTPA